MNYLLIIVGNLVTRSREMAVRKCYGAEPKNIHAIVFSEALVHVGLSIVLAAILVFLSKGTVEDAWLALLQDTCSDCFQGV